MKHLRRALTSHRLIRTQPEGVDASAPQSTHSEPPTPDPPYWTRRKPSFTPAEALDEHSHITLWDENLDFHEK
ncbi:hypothetical protein [Marinobacterium weihaiense]|uniref:Uncharacterized protein n=1 Tax=Marinobacterium weihaiense TaxID=2851016 RepID=A0ABS6MEP4_9GAMM|nr:hypothetical protein [Marinobacterium weihaiense]MBV0934590.1 hypothetical protein [Marinobacterium weihaiense]